MPDFVFLPLEVLFNIVELLSPSDLKALRRVSWRVSSVAAKFQFRRVALSDTNGRQRIKRIFEKLEPYLGRTRWDMLPFRIDLIADNGVLVGVHK